MLVGQDSGGCRALEEVAEAGVRYFEGAPSCSKNCSVVQSSGNRIHVALDLASQAVDFGVGRAGLLSLTIPADHTTP
ncbi:hypothetical protein Snoj_26540 [Streptomyces nojiriensis]|uniref:Uncharacterized protein n=1 Tax=Streptomyces nojiriensis TaxID=66374 RepID=A0ABQ3SKR7_9ACTN|nr:hypothetical protein [Streptomyces nojiriensis]GGS29929.1 hypothetical protein GCM10010205_70140 [Streptomyces nojiriensis]GHI68736.1 hypothetical protein Snoj_26540 [Streptomyces nojiriensis]